MKWLLLLLVVPIFLSAGSNPKKATAIRTIVAPRIDGLLNEPEWNLAPAETEFWQQNPHEGAPASFPTNIRILYDDHALYLAAQMVDPEPSKIVARLARRDDEVVADWIAVRLDSYHDHQTAFEFTVNAAGVKTDILIFNDGREEDNSWDAVWDVAIHVDDQGWVAEFKIPFDALRFSERPSHEWGVQFIRHIARTAEVQHWVLIRRSESGLVSKFGHLVGLENIPAPTNIQLIPYTVGSGRFLPASKAYPEGRELTSNAGFDLKYHAGSGLTIDATFNPDFGQVEADPAVLNLSTFETFYPEKRPFFIEGSQILRFTTFGGDFGPGLFYSRRIGRALRVSSPDGGYVEDEPRFATILGAAKISGKTSSGLSLGILEAVTSEETATLVDAAGRRTKTIVEPIANYSLIRLRHDLLQNSNVGMILTSVNKRNRLPAFTTGVDWNLKFDESIYRLDGFLAGSKTTDATGRRIDGSAGKVNFSKDGGPHWRGYASFDFTSKNYNINDIGFFRRPNDYGWLAQVLYRDDEVTNFKRIYNVSANWHLRRNFDGVELIHSTELRGYVMFPSYWEVDLEVGYDGGRYDDRETRGRGLFRKAVSRSARLQIESDAREDIVGELAIEVERDNRRGRSYGVGLEVELKPASNITLQVQVVNVRRENRLVWLSNPSAPLLPDGRGYALVGERTTSEWDLTTRGSFVFTRDVSLQVYTQLFFAKGHHRNLAAMTSPEMFVPLPNATWPDFNSLSLNLNVVFRWEYLPGSTLYLVWSQARQGDHHSASTSFGDDFRNTFKLPLENVLLLKVSYWLSL